MNKTAALDVLYQLLNTADERIDGCNGGLDYYKQALVDAITEITGEAPKW